MAEFVVPEVNLVSLQSHILAEESQHAGATGDFSWILSAISLATKTIGSKIRRARIENVLGDLGDENVHGETQQKLDVIANETIKRCLGSRANVGLLLSEEEEAPTQLRVPRDGGRYAVLFDPLDGSSNLDVCVGVGTIFSIVRLPKNTKPGTDATALLLSPDAIQVAAGYVLYGSSSVMVLTTGSGVDMFVLDLAIGSFVRVATKIMMPPHTKMYSINEAYTEHFPKGYRHYLKDAHASGYTSRYIGSMVADVHRTLLKGGVFLYPGTESHPQGKLRLLYEARPMAMLIEQAGGLALSGTTRILDLIPTDLHQRCEVTLGSRPEVERVLEFVGN
jgi:fructose-1,6-bisphosphatase I